MKQGFRIADRSQERITLADTRPLIYQVKPMLNEVLMEPSIEFTQHTRESRFEADPHQSSRKMDVLISEYELDLKKLEHHRSGGSP